MALVPVLSNAGYLPCASSVIGVRNPNLFERDVQDSHIPSWTIHYPPNIQHLFLSGAEESSQPRTTLAPFQKSRVSRGELKMSFPTWLEVPANLHWPSRQSQLSTVLGSDEAGCFYS